MKRVISIYILTFITATVFGQNRKLPPKDSYYSISNISCDFPKQIGKLEIIKNDSLKRTIFKSDSSEMILTANHFGSSLAEWDCKNEIDSLNLQIDSLATLLYLNGLLSSDLIIQATNVESKFIDYKGDTIDFTQHLEAKTIQLIKIERIKIPKKHKDKKNTILFEILVRFDPDENNFSEAYPTFNLYLKSEIKPTSSNIKEYLKSAKIHCLHYTATQL